MAGFYDRFAALIGLRRHDFPAQCHILAAELEQQVDAFIVMLQARHLTGVATVYPAFAFAPVVAKLIADDKYLTHGSRAPLNRVRRAV